MGGRELKITLSLKKRWWVDPLVRLYTLQIYARLRLAGLSFEEAEHEASRFIGFIGSKGVRVLIKE